MISIRQARRRLLIINTFNRLKIFGEYVRPTNNYKDTKKKLNDISTAIWNTFTQIPISEKEEIISHINDRITEAYKAGYEDSLTFNIKNKIN